MAAGRGTPREPVPVPLRLALWLVCLALVAAVGAFAWMRRGRDVEETAELATAHDSLAPTYTYEGEVIRWYVLVDPDTGVQYLVNDRGGCCVRIDHYGRIMGCGMSERRAGLAAAVAMVLLVGLVVAVVVGLALLALLMAAALVMVQA